MHPAFRDCVLSPKNIPGHYPISTFVRVSVLWDVFSAERSLKTESFVQPEDLRRLKCLSGSGCNQQLLRCPDSDTKWIEQWELTENRGGTKQATQRNTDALMKLSICVFPKGRDYIMCTSFLSLMVVGMTSGTKEAYASLSVLQNVTCLQKTRSAEPSFVTFWSDVCPHPTWDSLGFSCTEKHLCVLSKFWYLR